MPYDVKRFIFSVSLCAMLVANPVLATAPTNDEDLGTTHDVYVESTLNQATNGIAGVSYVNRMVNAAGNAADAAEAHAAAAGAHALSAAQSADEAHKVLADKVSIDQGADNKNKVMVTDDAGSVYAGYITNGMIATAENEIGKPLLSWSGRARWFQVGSDGIADGAVTADKIANGAVTSAAIADGAVTASKIARPDGANSGSLSGVLFSDGGVPSWSMIGSYMLMPAAVTSGKIANGAVTIEKTAGVVGMVPVGAEGATTYGSFWIE